MVETTNLAYKILRAEKTINTHGTALNTLDDEISELQRRRQVLVDEINEALEERPRLLADYQDLLNNASYSESENK